MYRATELYLVVGALLLGAGAAAVMIAEPFHDRAPVVRALPLRVAETDGKIRVDWDPAFSSVKDADAAVLEVQDGGGFYRYPVSIDVLKSGGLDYLRKSEDVLLTLTVYRHGHPSAQATVRTIGAALEPATAEPSDAPADGSGRDQIRSRRP